MRVRIGLITLAASMIVAGCAAPSAAPQATSVPASAPTTVSPFNSPTAVPTAAAQLEPTAAPSVASPARETFTVQRGDIINQLTLEGRISQVQQGVSFAEDGIVKQVLVTVGATVEQGQVLAELDLSDLTSQIAEARTAAEQDQRAVSQAAARGRIAVDQARLDLESARTQLERARQPARPEAIARARAAVQQAEADLQTVRNNASQEKNQAHREMDVAVQQLQIAQDRYAAAKTAFEKAANTTTEAALEQASDELRAAQDAVNRTRIAFDTARGNEVSQIQRAEADLRAAQAELDQLLAGPDPFDVAQAQQAVQRAQLALAAAQQQATADPELIKQAARSQAEVTRLEQQIAGRRLISPLSGQVTALEVAPGMAVRAASPIMTIANAANRQLVVEAPTTAEAARSSARLMIGQEVTISFARYPDQMITGTIASVPSRSADGTSGVNEYTISYNPGDLALDIGDVAEVTAVLGRVENALWLPPQAVRVSRDRAFVLIQKDGSEQRVEITTGLVTADRIEILGGLMEGDTVFGEVAATR